MSQEPTDPDHATVGNDRANGQEEPTFRSRRMFENSWAISLFGTAVGAGILFLPINAGAGGVWPLIIATLIIGPMTFLAQRGLSRFVAASRNPGADITVGARNIFGETARPVVTVLYYLAIFSIMRLYATAISD